MRLAISVALGLLALARPSLAVPFLLASAVAFVLGMARMSAARRWRAGGEGEQLVARCLRPLARHGWLILHDVPKGAGGNIDHVAAGPGGLFTIETKLTRVDAKGLTQARAHATWAARRFERPAVAILCLALREDRPHVRDGVWCMGAAHLRSFLGAQ